MPRQSTLLHADFADASLPSIRHHAPSGNMRASDTVRVRSRVLPSQTLHMPQHTRPERITQNRVIGLFSRAEKDGGLGYHYLGDWQERANNRNIEAGLLRENLRQRGYSDAQVSAALQRLETAADANGITSYEANRRVYQLLRYGVQVQTAAGKVHETIELVDWTHPERNDFGLAEEVTLRGGFERRPDLVLYVNGIAVVVIELKRGSVDVAEGIRQLITNQEKIFNRDFFTTVQLVLAGNDSQGLHYGTVGTPESYFIHWKDETRLPADVPGSLLDRPLVQMCDKKRLLDMIQHFVIFDAGIKKVPRPHQYAGMKAAQERIRQREGGVIWHTQGSGKSILMVLLAKWLLEFDPQARVLIVTDRDELDRQITGVMRNAGVVDADAATPRIGSRAQMVEALGATTPRLMCALVHKFDPKDLEGPPPPSFGRFYVFVDECHRTQGGNMNKQMKRWLQSAIFIGFTGTPLLRRDRQTTREVFGTYIHTYRFPEAVADGVVLDLKYEARDVPQQLTSPARVDAWFENKTRWLNNYQKALVRKRWATLEELMSAQERKGRIIASIIEDFTLRPRLSNDRGTAILVASSIYDACHYFRLFQQTHFKDHVGIVTSYEPNPGSISREPVGSDERYKYDTYTQHVLPGFSSTERYEEEIKRRFIEEPANTKLLIVVSKLLTGFDAPSCTYIYLDSELRDHTLFQAICRTNRLDGDDKDFGHIVDFKRLFHDLQHSIAVYSSDELDIDAEGADNNIEVKDWLVEGRARLEEAREELHHLCEPVPPPREMEQYLHYFCGHAENPEALLETEPLRVAFYKAVTTLVRAFGAISGDLDRVGYSEEESMQLRRQVAFYSEIRAAIKRYSGEELDIRPFEADMRHLLNTYVRAEDAQIQGDLDKVTLTDLIIRTGIHDAIALKINAQNQLSNEAVAETIINNVRKVIIQEKLTDPRFYEKMSSLLDDLIQQNRSDAEAYEDFLRQAEALVERLHERRSGDEVPEALRKAPITELLWRNLPAILALGKTPDDRHAEEVGGEYRNGLVKLTLQIDETMRTLAPAGWRGDEVREGEVLNALFPLLDRNREVTRALFELLKNQPDYP